MYWSNVIYSEQVRAKREKKLLQLFVNCDLIVYIKDVFSKDKLVAVFHLQILWITFVLAKRELGHVYQ